ncbi:MAG: AAA family ATPase [Planctomycetes bacterium]|nr:AAA family ATPase [Planctomycetota bacterium]
MATIEELDGETRAFRETLDRLQKTLGRVIVGQQEVVDHVICAVVAGGHVLLEGAPGLGKTLLVRTLADCMALGFARVQFTPDLMPADITGTNVIVEEDGRRGFRFHEGPVFTSVLLADEINRATPKTQSALLEAMQEHAVTVTGQRHTLPTPFFVLATQNPIEMEGTYPLPEAQLDRFLLKVVVPYPTKGELTEVLDRTTGTVTSAVEPVLDGEKLLGFQALAREVVLAPEVRDRAATLVLRTHPQNDEAPDTVRRFVRYGASPRGAQSLVSAAKVRALRQGRCQVDFQDVDAMALPTLRHRLILNFEGEAEGISPDDVVRDVLKRG